jgi:hypothetical protein
MAGTDPKRTLATLTGIPSHANVWKPYGTGGGDLPGEIVMVGATRKTLLKTIIGTPVKRFFLSNINDCDLKTGLCELSTLALSKNRLTFFST